MYSEEQRQEIMDRLCRMIAAGQSIRKACAHEGMPSKDTIFNWLYENAEFSDQYARARERRADARAERIDDVADDVREGKLGPNEARVIIDAEKWQAGKENSKRYGDKLDLTGGLNVTMDDERLESRVAQLLGKAGAVGAARGTGAQEEAS